MAPSTHAKGESFRDRRAGSLAGLKPTLVWKVCITQPRYREKSMAVTFCSHALASSVIYYSTYTQENQIYLFYT